MILLVCGGFLAEWILEPFFVGEFWKSGLFFATLFQFIVVCRHLSMHSLIGGWRFIATPWFLCFSDSLLGFACVLHPVVLLHELQPSFRCQKMAPDLTLEYCDNKKSLWSNQKPKRRFSVFTYLKKKKKVIVCSVSDFDSHSVKNL